MLGRIIPVQDRPRADT